MPCFIASIYYTTYSAYPTLPPILSTHRALATGVFLEATGCTYEISGDTRWHPQPIPEQQYHAPLSPRPCCPSLRIVYIIIKNDLELRLGFLPSDRPSSTWVVPLCPARCVPVLPVPRSLVSFLFSCPPFLYAFSCPPLVFATLATRRRGRSGTLAPSSIQHTLVSVRPAAKPSVPLAALVRANPPYPHRCPCIVGPSFRIASRRITAPMPFPRLYTPMSIMRARFGSLVVLGIGQMKIESRGGVARWSVSKDSIHMVWRRRGCGRPSHKRVLCLFRILVCRVRTFYCVCAMYDE